MRKLIAAVAAFSPLALFAEGTTSNIDLTGAASAATEIQDALTSFFTSSVFPLVLKVGGAGLAVYIVFLLFRWARRAGK